MTRSAFALVVILFRTLAAVQTEQTIVIRPTEIDDILVNPGMGIETFNRFSGQALNSFVQCLPGETFERFNAHPGIYQDVIDLGWTNDDGLLGLCGSQGAKQNNDESECASGHERSMFSCK